MTANLDHLLSTYENGHLTDPDGVSVQLQDTKYIGGLGPLGDRKP
jgi:hypothetical protein